MAIAGKQMRDFLTAIENLKLEDAVTEVEEVTIEPRGMLTEVRLGEIMDTYLAWISPDGEIHEVTDHETGAAEILGKPSESLGQSGFYCHQVLRLGYVRVAVYADEFGANGDKITPAQADALASLIKTLEEFKIYYINSMTFVLRRQALAAMNSLAKNT